MHSLYAVSIIVSLLELCCAFQNSKPVKKTGDYPYVVSLYRDAPRVNWTIFWYTGVLLTTEWILTSSRTHFRIDDEGEKDVFAYAGTLTAFPEEDNENCQRAKVIDIVRHPWPAVDREHCLYVSSCQYAPDNTDPMLLMKVDPKFNETDFVKPVILPQKKEFVDNCRKMTIVGWVRDDYYKHIGSGSGILKYVPATRQHACDKSAVLDDSYFCVALDDGVTQHLNVNAGQAVICNGTLIGITQRSPPFHVHPDFDDIVLTKGTVSNINYYTSWIHNETGLEVAYESTQQRVKHNEGEDPSEPGKIGRATTYRYVRRTYRHDRDEDNWDATLASWNGSSKLCSCSWFIMIIMLCCVLLA